MSVIDLLSVLSFGLTCFIAGLNFGKSTNDRHSRDDHS